MINLYGLKIESFIYLIRFLGSMTKKSLFLKMFGDSPLLRVLDFFMAYEDFDYSMTDIARNAGIGYSTLKLFWKDLIKYKIVKQTRIIGKAKLYQLNKQNSIVQQFRKLYWTTTKKETEKLLKQKIKI